MTASRTNNKAKDGSTVVRMYYSCGASRSKGSAICSANSVRKQDAEHYVMNRIKEVLDRPHILRAIVKGINDRKTIRIGPMKDELAAIQSRMAAIHAKKLRYAELYEDDMFEQSLFAGRLSELDADLERLLARKAELESELDGHRAEPVPYETVRSLIARFERLLRSSSTDQRKTLLHLIIGKITVTPDKKIDKIEMIFDEMTEQHFLGAAPSAAQTVEGAFSTIEKALSLTQKLHVVI
ncbi:hypothetical protein [Cohnella cellulosilytica]